MFGSGRLRAEVLTCSTPLEGFPCGTTEKEPTEAVKLSRNIGTWCNHLGQRPTSPRDQKRLTFATSSVLEMTNTNAEQI